MADELSTRKSILIYMHWHRHMHIAVERREFALEKFCRKMCRQYYRRTDTISHSLEGMRSKCRMTYGRHITNPPQIRDNSVLIHHFTFTTEFPMNEALDIVRLNSILNSNVFMGDRNPSRNAKPQTVCHIPVGCLAVGDLYRELNAWNCVCVCVCFALNFHFLRLFTFSLFYLSDSILLVSHFFLYFFSSCAAVAPIPRRHHFYGYLNFIQPKENDFAGNILLHLIDNFFFGSPRIQFFFCLVFFSAFSVQ